MIGPLVLKRSRALSRVFFARASGLLGGCGTFRGRSAGCRLAAQVAALPGGRVVFGLAASGAALLAAVGFLVDGGPGSALGFILGDAALLVALLDMLGHSLLLVGVTRFVSPGHGNLRLHTHFPFEPVGRPVVPKLWPGSGSYPMPWGGGAVDRLLAVKAKKVGNSRQQPRCGGSPNRL